MIRIFILWLSMFGYFLYIDTRFKIKKEFIFPIVFSSIIVLLFISGLLNFMTIMTYLIFLTGIVLLIYLIIKKKINIRYIKSLLDFNMIIILFLFAFFTIVSANCHLITYDNFSHWAVIVKQMLIQNALPNFESTMHIFKSYPPGSACFLYYVCRIIGKSEASMIIGQTILLISFYSTLFAFVDVKKKIMYPLLIAVILYFMIGSVAFFDLPVDSLLAAVEIACISFIVYYKDDIKKNFVVLTIFSVFLILLKNTGIVFVGLNFLILLYLGIKQKKIKFSFIFLFICFIFLFLWQKHLLYVFPGTEALDGKHSLSMSNFLASINEKGEANIIKILKLYFTKFITIKGNLINILMLFINGLYIFSVMLIKKQRKFILMSMIFQNILYIGYYLILGVMYILSMPTVEALVLASYDRYMLTIIFIIMGIYIITINNISLINIEKNELNEVTIISILSILIIIFFFSVENIKILIGNQNYKGSVIERVNMLPDRNDSCKTYLVYSNKESNYGGYLYFTLKYKFEGSTIKVVNDTNLIQNYNDWDLLLAFDEDNNILNYIENNKLQKYVDNYYYLNERKC